VTKLVRCRDNGGKEFHGRLEGDVIVPLTGELSSLHPAAGLAPARLDQVTLLAPVKPTKIVAVGPNYHAHLKGGKPPPRPFYWLKPASALLDPGGCVVIPGFVPIACHESELAIVIGRTTHNVSPNDAPHHILGYTCINDVTAGDVAHPEVFLPSMEFIDGKIFDTFAPLGPIIDTAIDPSNLLIQCRLNGEVRQHHRTSDMIFHPHKLVAMISRVLTLYPGDVIATGSPPGVGKLSDGDIVEVEVEGIGVLRHSVSISEHT